MPTKQRDSRPTPNGGEYSEIYYQDKDGNAVEKKEATHCEIVECDADGNVIHRTYGMMKS